MLWREKELLLSIGILAIGYILVRTLVIFSVEPESLESFFDVVCQVCISLTTRCYGAIFPVSSVGCVMTMLSSLVGVALITLPANIITVGYIEEMRR